MKKYNNALNILFPQTCNICGKLNKQSICNKCKIRLDKVVQNVITNRDIENIYFEELIYFFKYEGIIRKLIIDYKFNEKSYMYEGFVNFILKDKKIFEKMKTYDTIIPVPISKKRMKQRGYNQSLLIARKISKDLNIKLEDRCLYKTQNIIEQSKLNKEERKQNIQNVYELVNREILTNKQILLIDDIYTTGSTVNECAKLLRNAKPKKIDVLVLAKD